LQKGRKKYGSLPPTRRSHPTWECQKINVPLCGDNKRRKFLEEPLSLAALASSPFRGA
jgi:hypothetical protein